MRNKARATTCLGGWGVIYLATLVGVAVMATPAQAKSRGGGGKRIAILPPTDGTARDAVITTRLAKALKKQKLRPVTGGAVKRAVAMGVPAADDEWIALARKLRVDGILEPIVSGSGTRRRVEVVVHNGSDGSVAGRETFSAKGSPAKLAAAAAAGLWRKLGSTIRGTEPPRRDSGPRPVVESAGPPEPLPGERTEEPAPAASEPVDTMPAPSEDEDRPPPRPTRATLVREDAEEDDEADESDEEADQPPARGKRGKSKAASKLRALEVEIGGRALQRLFEYKPASAGTAYSEKFLPTIQGRAMWFPVTYAGVFVMAEFNSSLKSGSNPSFPTGTRELVLGAQGRYPLSFGTLGVSAAYFQHLFVIGDTSDPNDRNRQDLAWPDTAYQGARFAANARFYLWSVVQLGVEAAYRLVTNPGQGGLRVRSTYYFPEGMASYGLDGSAFVGVGLMPWLEVRGGIDYRQYGFGSLTPGPDNTAQTSASGATDKYLGYTLGLVGVFGGK